MKLITFELYIPIVLCCLVLLLAGNYFSLSYSADSSILRQSIKDAPIDWINIDRQTAAGKGDPATDIVEVTYFTNNETFNSTLWLLFPFKELPVGYSTLNYGILIDSDFDERTGIGGIDYQLEIRWDNETNTWSRLLTEWSSSAVGGRIIEENKNLTISSNDDQYYVSIPIKLEEILNPNRYRVVYYAESKTQAGPLTTDFTKWITVPPPEIKITPQPQLVKLRQGETKTIELLINSSSNSQPDIRIYSKNEGSSPVLEIDSNVIKMPSDGFARIPVTIRTSTDTPIAPHTVSIYANSTFPSLEFIRSDTTSSSLALDFPIEIKAQDKVTESSLLIEIEEPLTLTDKISEFWNKLGEPLSFLYGIIAGLSPTIFNIIKKKLTKQETH